MNELPFFFVKYHIDYFLVCLSLNARHRLSVDIHRCCDARVAHQFLLYLERSTRSIKPGTVCVPESVPAYVRPDPGSYCRFFDVFLLNLLLVVRSPRPGVRKNPVVGPLKKGLPPPFLKDTRQIVVERYDIPRILYLNGSDSTMNNASLNQNA